MTEATDPRARYLELFRATPAPAPAWVRDLRQGGIERLYFFRRALRGRFVPELRTYIEIFHSQAIPLAYCGFKLFRCRKVVQLGKMR